MWRSSPRLVGIGRATARPSLKEFATALLARSKNLLSEVADEREVEAQATPVILICDVSDESAVDSRVSQRPGIVSDALTSLINSAGLSLNGEVDGYCSKTGTVTRPI